MQGDDPEDAGGGEEQAAERLAAAAPERDARADEEERACDRGRGAGDLLQLHRAVLGELERECVHAGIVPGVPDGAMSPARPGGRTGMTILDTRTRWLALYVLCLASLMIVLDTTIVNVALPSIRADLGFSQT